MTNETTTDCACTGVRWCARCLDPSRRRARKMDDPVPTPDLLGDGPIECDGQRVHAYDLDTQTTATCPDFVGLHVLPGFISEEEAHRLVDEIESQPFSQAQSGKQKQHYGPKINFNKRRMNSSRFSGIPPYAHAIEARLREVLPSHAALYSPLAQALERYRTTDVFVLRYEPGAASNLDFHVDDTFAYGEVILDLSLESDSILTFYRGRPGSEVDDAFEWTGPAECVRVPLPSKSLVILSGPARFEWEHAILARDIRARRTSVTLRTLGAALRDTEEGRNVIMRTNSSSSGTL